VTRYNAKGGIDARDDGEASAHPAHPPRIGVRPTAPSRRG
jgi:hypothetical protein